MCSSNFEYEKGDPIPSRRYDDKFQLAVWKSGLVRIPVDPAGDCCYESSIKPCKSEDSQESRLNAQ